MITGLILIRRKVCSVLIWAIWHSHEEVIALYIRNRADINSRLYNGEYGNVLPFEAPILHGRPYVAEMFLVAGCSCGKYSLGKNGIASLKSDLKDLIEEGNVLQNNVIPLEQQCRRMLLNHLSPQIDKKIMKLPLPPHLIRYLYNPELDNILNVCKTSTRNQHKYGN